MIRRWLRHVPAAFIYACVATMVAQAVAVAALLASGTLTREKVLRMLAVAYEIDLEADAENGRSLVSDEDRYDASLEQVVEARTMKDLNLDLRQQALDKGLEHLRRLQDRLAEERRRYEALRTAFDDSLAELEEQKKDAALTEVQRTLEAIRPNQAKDQLLKMLESEPVDGEDPMEAVVMIVRGMALDKRKKIFAEFKTEQEAEKLAEILREIRLGAPEMPLIDSTRDQLEDDDFLLP